ncbi:MAG: hypothetical protein ACXV5N_10065 [Halobacteriota archaeon]
MAERPPKEDTIFYPASPGTEHDELVARCAEADGLEQLMKLMGPEEPQMRELGPYFRCGHHTADYKNPFHKPKFWRIIPIKKEGIGKCEQVDINTCRYGVCQENCYVNLKTGEVERGRFGVPDPLFISEAIHGILSRTVRYDTEVMCVERFFGTEQYADILIQKRMTCGYQCTEQHGEDWIDKVAYQRDGENVRIRECVPIRAVIEYKAGEIIDSYLVEVKPTLRAVGEAIRQIQHYERILMKQHKVSNFESHGKITRTHLAIVTYSTPDPKYVRMIQNKGICAIRCDKDTGEFQLLES